MITLFWTFTVLLNLKIRVSETDRQSAPVSCMIPLWRERIESHRVCMKDKTKSRITVDTCFTLIFQVLFYSDFSGLVFFIIILFVYLFIYFY